MEESFESLQISIDSFFENDPDFPDMKEYPTWLVASRLGVNKNDLRKWASANYVPFYGNSYVWSKDDIRRLIEDTKGGKRIKLSRQEEIARLNRLNNRYGTEGIHGVDKKRRDWEISRLEAAEKASKGLLYKLSNKFEVVKLLFDIFAYYLSEKFKRKK